VGCVDISVPAALSQPRFYLVKPQMVKKGPLGPNHGRKPVSKDGDMSDMVQLLDRQR
jgi:hypothetical protein